MGSAEWVVRLGAEEWKRFTYQRDNDASLRLLGSVQRGARIGALALLDDGRYVQLNGDYQSPIDNRDVRRALARAKERVATNELSNRPRTSPAPVIVIKRRRPFDRVP